VSRSGYSARAVALLHGTYFLTNTDARAGIHAIVYGFTDEESYGYPAGMNYRLFVGWKFSSHFLSHYPDIEM